MKKTVALALLAMLLFVGCKSRQVAKQHQETEVKNKQETQLSQTQADRSSETKTSEETKVAQTNTQSVITADGIKVTPIDKGEPMVIEDPEGRKTTFTNAEVEFTKTKEETTKQEAVTETGTEQVQKQNDVQSLTNFEGKSSTDIKQENDNKQTDSQPFKLFSYWWLALLFLFVVLLVRWLYKKYKRFKNPLKPF